MKNKWGILTAFFLIFLTGCGNQTFERHTGIITNTEELDLNIEKQLKVISDSYEWRYPQSGNVYRMFAVTDLDQNERLELIVSRLEGSGQYTYSDYYEVNKELNGLTLCEWPDRGIASEADIMADSVPVYYDSHNKIYYYIFTDVIKDGIHYSYESKRAIALTDGKLSERILAYQNTYREDLSDSSVTITCEDADGNEIGKNEYDLIEETIFTDFIKKEACFFWFDLNEPKYDDLSENEIAVILRKSYDGFLIQ